MGILIQALVHVATGHEASTCTDGLTLQHSSDCTAYYECSNNKFLVRFCPANLHFNAALGVCDYPSSANCPWINLPTNPSIEPTTSTSTPQPTTQPPYEQPVNLCPKNESGFNIFFPHPNCSLYYICNWGEVSEKSCPYGKHWNAEKYYCDWIVYAKCEEGAAPPQLNEQIRTAAMSIVPDQTCPEQNNTKVAIHLPHLNCEQYYVCNSGIAIEMTCSNGLHFSQELDICVTQEEANCV